MSQPPALGQGVSGSVRGSCVEHQQVRRQDSTLPTSVVNGLPAGRPEG